MSLNSKHVAESPDIESIVQGMGQYADSHRLSRKKVTRIERLANNIRHRVKKGPLIFLVVPALFTAFLLFAVLPWIILLAAWLAAMIKD